MAETLKGVWREIDSLPVDDGTRGLVKGKPRDDGIYKSLQVLIGSQPPQYQIEVDDIKNGELYVAVLAQGEDIFDALTHPFAYGAELVVQRSTELVTTQ